MLGSTDVSFLTHCHSHVAEHFLDSSCTQTYSIFMCTNLHKHTKLIMSYSCHARLLLVHTVFIIVECTVFALCKPARMSFVKCCYGSFEVKARQSSCPIGDRWKLSKYGDHNDTPVIGPAALTWQGTALLCVCACVCVTENTGCVWYTGSAGDIYYIVIRQWQGFSPKWQRYPVKYLWMHVYVCKWCLWKWRYCGQNIPRLDKFLCVLPRRDMQVGGVVFENDHLCI